MTNPWTPNDGNSKYVTLERVTLSSLRGESENPALDLEKLGDLLKDDSLLAEEVLEQVAERLEGAGRFEEALAMLPQDLLRRKDPLPPHVLAKLWYRFASLNRWVGNTPRAIWCTTNALHIFQELKDTVGIGMSHALIGYCYWMIDEYAIAYDHLIAARMCQEQIGDTRLLAQTIWNLAVVNHLEGHLEEARDDCQKGLELLEKVQPHVLADHLTMGKLYNTLALVDSEEGHSRQAVINCQKAIVHWSASKDKGLMALGFANLAAAQIAIGEWRQAETSLVRAQELIQGQNQQTACLILKTLSSLYVRQGKHSEAESYARRAVEIAIESGLKSAEASGWETLGEVLLAQGRVEDAINQFQHSLQINSKIGRLVDLPYLYLRLAEACLARPDLEAAHQYLRQTYDLPNGQATLHFNALITRIKGQWHIARDELNEGITCLAQSISLFESISYPYDAACSHLELGTALARKEDSQAISHLETALKTFSDLGAEFKRARTAELLMAFQKSSRHEPRTANALTVDHVVVLERLNAATTSHELLLRELAVLIHHQARMEVIIFEEFPHGFMKPIVMHGFSDREVEKLAQILHTHLETGQPLPPQIQVKALADTAQANEVDPQRHFWVFLKGGEASLLSNAESLNSLLRIAGMGLEICRLRSLVRAMRRTVNSFTGTHVAVAGMICQSPAMRKVITQIQKVRSSDATVLITGESGVGKELVARAIHTTSARHLRPFIPFNCAAIAAELVESRLFGHLKGAFTGADKDAIGVIRAASGGTLFLDEIGELTLSVQPKLLRFLQEHEIHALGDNHPLRVDVRVLAATNRDLDKEAERGAFREDLYHRLNVIRIHVPPLRERAEDIPLLARAVLTECAKKEHKSIVFSEAALELLCLYSWPGNVRQLKNEIERVVVMAEPEAVVMPEDFSSEIRQRSVPSGSTWPRVPPTISKPQTLAEALEEVERRIITDALQRHNGNISRVARELDISRNGLALKCKRLNLEHTD